MEQNLSRNWADTGIKLLLRIPEALLAVLVAALMIFVTGSVIARYVIRIGIPWSDEAAELLFVWVVFLGFSVGLRYRSNVAVEIVTDRLPQPWLHRFTIAQDLVVLIFSIIFTWQSVVTMGFASMQRFTALRISMSWLYASALIAGILMIVYALANLWDTVRNKSQRRDGLAESAYQHSE